MLKQFLFGHINKLKTTLLYYMSHHDSLTKVHNRYGLDEKLKTEWNRAIRKHYSVSLLMIDIDYFKQYNDTYGHLAGDDFLTRLAQLVTDQTEKANGLVARFGGDEFIVLLPNTIAEKALTIAEQIRKSL